jgi:hypothetical protein
MRTKFAKVKITRAPQCMTGLDAGMASKQADAVKHDKMVAGFDRHTVLAAAKDLGHRRCWDYSNPEHRWCLGRLAALARRIDNERITA